MTDRQRAKRIVMQLGLGCLSNDTKWREFFCHVVELRVPLEVKLIYEAVPFQTGCVWSPSKNYIEGSGGMGPVLFVFIEWVRSQAVEEVGAVAGLVGLECEVGDEGAKVYGYR